MIRSTCEICGDPATRVDIELQLDGRRSLRHYCDKHFLGSIGFDRSYCVKQADIDKLKSIVNQSLDAGSAPSVAEIRDCYPLFESRDYEDEGLPVSERLQILERMVQAMESFLTQLDDSNLPPEDEQ